MEEEYPLTLQKTTLTKFIKVFNKVELLNTKEIDILIIVSIKNKLKIASLEDNEKISIIFLKDEYRVFKILLNQYIQHKKNDSSLFKEFDKYLEKQI